MNTKIIVDKKVHKLPSNVVSVADITNIVKTIYPNKKNVLLWALPNPGIYCFHLKKYRLKAHSSR